MISLLSSYVVLYNFRAVIVKLKANKKKKNTFISNNLQDPVFY